MIKKVLFLGLLSSGLPLHAYIYELKIMRIKDPKLGAKDPKEGTKNPKSDGYKYFIGCSDFHDKTNDVTGQQLNHLNTALASTNKNSVEVLVEDLSSPGSNGRMACGRFCINSRGGVLGGLTEKCASLGLKVTNLEYRYCRVASLGPVLNNLTKKPQGFPSVVHTTVAALATEVDAVMQEVQTYKDGDALQASYQESIMQVHEHLTPMKACQPAHMSVADYLERHSTAENRLELIKHLLTFDSCLLDEKMAHAVVHATVPKVIAIAGGAHITRVAEKLEKVGWETVYATNVEFHNEHDLTKCLGSTIVDGAYCVRPEPIDLSILQQYVN